MVLLLIFIIAIIVIKPYIWHPFEESYSIKGTVKSVNFVGTRSQRTIYVNFETTDGRIYNFHYNDDPSPWEEIESFLTLTKLTEGDEVELSIYSVGYYFVNSEKKRIAIYVTDVKWLK